MAQSLIKGFSGYYHASAKTVSDNHMAGPNATWQMNLRLILTVVQACLTALNSANIFLFDTLFQGILR